MTFQEVEDIFNRALKYSFSKRKFLFMFPVLLVCGVLIVFCRAVSLTANPWVGMSLAFMPVFLCTGILLAAGVLLIRMYYHEVKGVSFQFRKLLSQSLQLLIGVSYLSLPLILSYLLLWTMMGVFHLVKGIPGIGDVIGVLLAFCPFLLVLASLALSFVSLLILFFVTPHFALKNGMQFHIAEEIIERIKGSLFANCICLLIGLAPLMVSGGFLTLAAIMTGVHHLSSTATIGISLQWFFIMVPFAAIVTPFVIFFFNFATESFALMQKRAKKESAPIKVDVPKEEACEVQS